MKCKEISNLVEMDLGTRQKLAQGVIMNAKEIISVGLHGKQTKKIIALVPVSLIKVDHAAYQREEKKHVVKMSKEWDDSQCTLLLVNYRSAEGWFYAIDGQHRAVAVKCYRLIYWNENREEYNGRRLNYESYRTCSNVKRNRNSIRGLERQEHT